MGDHDRSLILKADDTQVKSEMPPSNTTDKDGQSESCELEEEVEYFRKFLNKVQDCLAGRSKQTDNSEEHQVNFESGTTGADDEGRCFEIVRRVVDEETALEMVAAFLLITQDHRVPPTASIHFHSCYFDSSSGL